VRFFGFIFTVPIANIKSEIYDFSGYFGSIIIEYIKLSFAKINLAKFKKTRLIAKQTKNLVV